MSNAWLVSPWFLDVSEPGLRAAAPREAAINPAKPHAESPEGLAPLHRAIADFVHLALAGGQRPIAFTGDCMAAIPALSGVYRAGLDPTLVWIDAHGDFNTPETSPSGALVGMPLAMMTGRGPQGYCEGDTPIRLEDRKIVRVDVRDLDPGEADLVEAARLPVFSMAAFGTLTIEGPVHVHFDPDVICAEEAPGFRFPAPGGPTVEETCTALARFAAANDIRSISLGGWTPALDPDGRTEAAVRAAFQALTGSLT